MAVQSYLLQKDFSYAVFCQEGYVSETDIDGLKSVLRHVVAKNIKKMLSQMAEGKFEFDNFSKVYSPQLSLAIKNKITSVERTNLYTDLGGWQLLKPTKGLDKGYVRYNVACGDDGWYDISSSGSADVVSVKVMYAGKYLSPVIVGLKNKAYGMDICDTDYDHSIDSKMLAYNTYDKEYMFLEFLCPMVYKGVGSKSLLSEADFDRFTAKVNERKMSFVRQFYNNVKGSGNNLKKIRKDCFYSLPQRLVAMADSQIAKKDNDAGMFLPCSYDEFAKGGYGVTYLGKDWYEVSAPESGGRSLKLKVVLYGKKLRPAIMGIDNPAHGVNYCPERFR